MQNALTETRSKTPNDVLKFIDSEKFMVDLKCIGLSDYAMGMLDGFFRTVELRVRLERSNRNITASSSGIRAARLKQVVAEENDQLIINILGYYPT